MNERWSQLLSTYGARFSDGRVVGYSAPNTLSAPQVGMALCDLSHYGLLQVAGADAQPFLQGQFTNDIKALEDGHAQWSGWCSPKGRLLVTFLIWRDQSTFFLALPKALLPAIQKRLGMFVLRSKVNITDASDTLQRFGITGVAADPLLGDVLGDLPRADLTSVVGSNGRIIRLSASRYLLVAATDVAEDSWRRLTQKYRLVPATSWDLAGIRHGIIEVTPETQDSYVPQMVNFELIGGVSFKKGCYPGQEIVARTQYRGILKRRTVRVSFTADATPPPGTPVYSPSFDGQACGTIALAAATDTASGSVEALVVTQIESLAGTGLFLDQNFTQPMQILDLPYSIS